MKKTTKVLALMLCAVLLVTATVAGTLAYLTSQDTVTNTFTVGNVTITLDETLVTLYGEPGKKVTVTEGEGEEATTKEEIQALGDGETPTTTDANTYKLIPGHTYTKDPTIHVDENSEDCYLFAKIENGLGTNATINFATGTKWTQIGTSQYWKYAESVSAGDDVEIFESFTFLGTADPAEYGNANITVTAYAIQADGSANVDAAWSKLKTEYTDIDDGTTNP